MELTRKNSCRTQVEVALNTIALGTVLIPPTLIRAFISVFFFKFDFKYLQHHTSSPPDITNELLLSAKPTGWMMADLKRASMFYRKIEAGNRKCLHILGLSSLLLLIPLVKRRHCGHQQNQAELRILRGISKIKIYISECIHNFELTSGTNFKKLLVFSLQISRKRVEY